MSKIVRADTTRLGSPAALVTTTGLRLADGISYDEWLGIGRQLATLEGQFAWCVGDWLAYGSRSYERGQYERAVEVTGRDKTTVRAYKRVAEGVESARRRADSELLTWTHYAEIAHLEVHDQERLLDAAESLGWSTAEIRREAARLKPNAKAPAPHLTVKAVGDLYALCAAEAERQGTDPAEWAQRGLAWLAEHGSPHLQEHAA